MRIVIPKNDVYTPQFVSWIVRIIKEKLLYTSASNSRMNQRRLAMLVVSSIRARETMSSYIIYVDDVIRVGGKPFDLAAQCRLADYGSLDHKGYPLFTKVFNHVKANLSQYYEWFLLDCFM